MGMREERQGYAYFNSENKNKYLYNNELNYALNKFLNRNE